MAERAGLSLDDMDVSGFTAKKPVKKEQAETEAIRAVSEKANFQSREPAPKTVKKERRRWRTGRNVQFATKVTQACRDGYYEIADQREWVLGYTLERALAALQRELLDKKHTE